MKCGQPPEVNSLLSLAESALAERGSNLSKAYLADISTVYSIAHQLHHATSKMNEWIRPDSDLRP